MRLGGWFGKEWRSELANHRVSSLSGTNPSRFTNRQTCFGTMLFSLRGVGAAEVEDGLHRFHLHPGEGEFEASGADAGLQVPDDGAQPVGHAAQRHATSGAGGVFYKAFDGGGAFAFVSAGFEVALGLNERQQFCASIIADSQPLVVVAAHAAHGDVGQAVVMIDADFARERNNVRETGMGACGRASHPSSSLRRRDPSCQSVN